MNKARPAADVSILSDVVADCDTDVDTLIRKEKSSGLHHEICLHVKSRST